MKVRSDRPRGQAMVEYALALPILVFILLGGANLILALHNLAVVQGALEEGARLGAIGASDGAIRDAIHDKFQKGYWDTFFFEGRLDSGIRIVPADTDRSRGDLVVIETPFRFGVSTGFSGDVFMITLPTQAWFSVERPKVLLLSDFEGDSPTYSWRLQNGGTGTVAVSTASPYMGSKNLRLSGPTASGSYDIAEVEVNASGLRAVQVTFWHNAAGLDTGTGTAQDQLLIEASVDSGSSYDLIGLWDGSTYPTSYTPATLFLTASKYRVSNLRLRWRAKIDAAGEYWNVDEVRISETY